MINHKQLAALRLEAKTRTGRFQLWKPGFALLPSGVHVNTIFLRGVTDETLFVELFGAGTYGPPDHPTQSAIRIGYARVAELTADVISKAMRP